MISRAFTSGFGLRGKSIFWIFDLLQLTFVWQKNSRTKVEKALFFIYFHVFLCGNEFLGPKVLKKVAK
jgi:hypothetical protein